MWKEKEHKPSYMNFKIIQDSSHISKREQQVGTKERARKSSAFKQDQLYKKQRRQRRRTEGGLEAPSRQEL